MIKVKVDTSDFQRSLKRFERETEKTVFDGMKELAASASKELAVRTKPFGITGKAKKYAQAAVGKDVSKAYASHGRTYNELRKISPKKAYAYAHAINNNDFEAAQKIVRRTLSNYEGLSQVSDGGRHLESVRGSDGHVQTPNRIGLIDHTEYGEILEKKIPTAGLVKGVFLACAQKLGGKPRIQVWLRKGAELASTIARKTRKGVEVSITNNADYASTAIRPGDIVKAVKNAERLQTKKMQRTVDRLAKNA